jgi:DNA-binding CsgD family transcriptional regulator
VEHRVASAERFDPQLADELVAMADAAHQRRNLGLASQYRRWAADLCDDVEKREQLLLDSWYELLLDGNSEAVTRELDTIRAMQSHPKVRLVLGALATQQGRPHEAVRQLHTAIGQDAALRDASLTARLRCELGWAHFYAGHSADDVLGAIELISNVPGLEVDVREGVAVLTALGEGLRQGASAAIGRLAPAGPAHDIGASTRRVADLLVVRGTLHLARGEPAPAAVELSRTVMHYRSGLPSRLIAMAYSHLALARWLLGEWAHAAEISAVALETATGVDEASASACSAIIAATRGDFVVAKRLLARAANILDAVPHPDAGAMWSLAAYTIADAATDRSLLRDHLDDPITRATHDRMRKWQADWWLISHAQALLDAGRIEQAEDMADELPLAADTTVGLRLTLGRLRAAVARHRGDHERAAQIYEDATALPGTGDAMPLFEAHLRHDQGRLLMSLGDRQAGTGHLRAARRIYYELGAQPYLHRTGTELTAAGTDLHEHDQSAESSLGSLTARERDIALLAARGLTNREMAERLFVTPKTIEYHLSNIYAKGGFRNRRELRQRLGSN